MGCGQSKNQIGIAPKATDVKVDRPKSKTIRVQETDPRTHVTQLNNNTNSDLEGDDLEIPPAIDSKKHRLLKQNTWTGSQDSLSDGRFNPRNGSATSKFSKHSTDSGVGFEDAEWNNIITEESAPEKIKQVEQGWSTPRELDLGVVGKAVPQRFSAKDKDRLEEQRILASLREEGIIRRGLAKASGGMAMEFVVGEQAPADPFGPAAKPPARLAKLEKRKKKKKVLTQEDIQAKLEQAEARRKEKEQKFVEKVHNLTVKSDVQNALESFAQQQKEKEEVARTKEDIAAENREKRLKEMRDKLKAKQEHAEMVRKRKKVTIPDENENEAGLEESVH